MRTHSTHQLRSPPSILRKSSMARESSMPKIILQGALSCLSTRAVGTLVRWEPRRARLGWRRGTSTCWWASWRSFMTTVSSDLLNVLKTDVLFGCAAPNPCASNSWRRSPTFWAHRRWPREGQAAVQPLQGLLSHQNFLKGLKKEKDFLLFFYMIRR